MSLPQAGGLVALLDRVALEPQNLTSINGIVEGIDRHLSDSVVAISIPEIRDARHLCDLGSGGGFPGLVLAHMAPSQSVTLVESERGKADWLSRASASSPNVRVVHDRSEHLAARERETFDVVTARAVGRLPVVLELAAPLIAVGGVLVAWRGRVDPDEDLAAHASAEVLGLRHRRRVDVEPFAGAHRCLDIWEKMRLSPSKYPRRPGMAVKRPIA